MTDEKPSLVVIDDNLDFLNQLGNGLTEYFQACLVHIPADVPPAQLAEHVVEQVGRATPDYLVLDVNLRGTGQSMDLLRLLRERAAIPDPCRIWLISQAVSDDPAEVIGAFQRIDAYVQSRLLPKPIRARRLWAELTDQSIYEPEPHWDDFPLPFRVCGERGKVLFCNNEWKSREYPDPSLFLSPGGGIKRDRRDFTGSFQEEAMAGFTVHSFPLEQHEQRFLAQVAEMHPLDAIPRELNDTLDRIFAAIRGRGFHHARFYRVRALAEHKDDALFDRVLELTRLSYSLSDPISLPYRLPLKGELKRRLEGYPTPDKADFLGGLIYKIRLREEDEAAQDPLVDDLNLRLGLQGIGSWLEVPVWMHSEFFPGAADAEDRLPGYEIAGWLFFDRRRPQDDPDPSAMDTEVTEENVKPVTPVLRSLVALLTSALWQERLWDLWAYEERMRRLDQQLMLEQESRARFQIILDALCTLGEATSGVMVLEDETWECLKVVGLRGEKIPPMIEKLCFPLDAVHHPIVHAWRTGGVSACQDFQTSDMRKVLLDKLGSGPRAPYLDDLTDDELKVFTAWVGEDIKGLLAIAISLPGGPDTRDQDRRIGGITLQFGEGLFITRCRWEKIDAVLQRARWVIQQHRQVPEERTWRMILGHEMKSDLNIAINELDELARQHMSIGATDEFRQARLWTQQARDLAENLMDFARTRLEERRGHFSPEAYLRDYLQLSAVHMASDNIAATLDPPWGSRAWTLTLVGDEQVFGRVIRVLLTNAFKFGRDSLGPDEAVPVPISICAREGAGGWVLEIANPGHLQRRWEHGSDGHRPPGSGVGLAVARRWTRVYGGTLNLKQSPKVSQVRATLTWPIAHIEGETK